MRQKSAICFLYLFLSVLCYGQTGKLFTVDNELSSSMVNSIYQDKEDIIWIATEDGLNRYDGAKFSVYKHDSHDEHSLQNNYVRILFDYISYFANVFISSSIFSTKSSSFIAPTSPSFLLRTPTLPASCSLSPTTSMYGTF